MFRCRTAFGIALVLFLLSSIATHAQVGVYATANGNWFGGVSCPSFASPCALNNGKVTPFGGNFGAYYDFRTVGPFRLGVDVRGADEGSNKRADSSAGGRGIVREYEALGGVRASFHTPVHWLRPYAELAGGFARNNSSGLYTNTITINNAATPPITQSNLTFNPATYNDYTLIKGFVGVDVPLFPYLSIRAIEIGEGAAFGSAPIYQTTTVTTNGTTSTTTTVVNTRSSDTHGVQSIGAGVVFTFPVRK